MCGVVGIVYGRDNERLGRVGSFLLKKLEYRGYDSTGGAFFKADGSIVLKKKVGSPTQVIHELDLEKQSGRKFIGQVRWATYGAVSDENAQPHEVSCRTHLLGAHNGNISNTDSLKEFLADARHRIVSDNDGEMLVHLVEHFYHEQLALRREHTATTRVDDLLQAILRANRKAQGSYAACVSAPDIEGIFAVKAGSSLYAGKGSDEDGDFILVSSDLTSVLAKTRFLIPLVEGQGIYFSAGEYFVFSLQDGSRSVPGLKRSKLNIADIALQPKYHFFMEQEIASTAANLGEMLKYYFARDWEAPYFSVFERHVGDCKEIVFDLLKLYAIFDREQLRRAFLRIVNDARFAVIVSEIGALSPPRETDGTPAIFSSDEAQLLRELREFGEEHFSALFTLDLIVIWKKKRKVIRYKDEAVALFRKSFLAGGRVFFIGAGTSYHAALTAGYFFNNLTSLAIVPCNPDLFRSVYMNSLRPGDVLVAITQSGETKDLVDILNQAREKFARPGGRDRRGQQRELDHSPGKGRLFPAAALRPGDRRRGHQVLQRPAGPVLPAGRRPGRRGAAAAAQAGADPAPHRAHAADLRRGRHRGHAQVLSQALHPYPGHVADRAGARGGAEDPRSGAEPRRGLRCRRIQARAEHHPGQEHPVLVHGHGEPPRRHGRVLPRAVQRRRLRGRRGRRGRQPVLQPRARLQIRRFQRRARGQPVPGRGRPPAARIPGRGSCSAASASR